MLSVIVLGTGNLAHHLSQVFYSCPDLDLIQVYGRNKDNLKPYQVYAPTCSEPLKIKDADVYIIAVKDNAIRTVSQLVADKKGMVVHTSGAMEMKSIAHENSGVFYPLQTFSKERALNFNTIPVCIEAKQQKGLEVLEKLGASISKRVHHIDSEQRKKLHLAAVFVNNFTNYLYSVGEDICEKEKLPFDLLRPLILETAEKVQGMSTFRAQTGPARRGDSKSVEKHLELLEQSQEQILYKLLSEAIKTRYEEKL
ncbi:Rossmann-like and DUF2520 domain-containing protein [Flagellimonas flava]|uniref:DUF2520 domain-containing protein n=1 Tax=Flagellimonas flava TaxID=570519 RepID=A0A1M5J2Y0_9FLAO|nr:DUF2520 domain-containing protein [Allomuricauda flava]SHG34968.1 protein of unknown function [Allomuricauda flava]